MLWMWIAVVLACTSPTVGEADCGLTPTSTPQAIAPHDVVRFAPYPPVEGAALTVTYTGRLAGREGVIAEVGFDGWGLRSAPAGASTGETLELDRYAFQRFTMTSDTAGSHATFDLPDGVRAVHLRFYDPVTAEIDDRNGREFHLGVTYPYIGPYLTLPDDPATEAAIHFEVTDPGPVDVVLTDPLGAAVRVTSTSDDTQHHVVVGGLAPGTAYTYRIEGSDGRVSASHVLTTAVTRAETFGFVVVADMQDAGGPDERWSDVALAIEQTHPDAAFVLAPGDLASNDHPGPWWLFFDAGRSLFASTPLVPVIGNHDTRTRASHADSRSFARYFDRPLDELARRVDYGSVDLFVLSSELPAAMTSCAPAYGWLDDALDEADGTWAFAAFHHSPYDASERFALEQPLYRPVTALFEGRVDWVFTGHTHIAQRFLPLRYGAEPAPSGLYGRGDDDGVGYLVLPGCETLPIDGLVAPGDLGSEARDLLVFPELAQDQVDVDVEHGWAWAEVTPEQLTLMVYGIGWYDDEVPPHVRDQVVHPR